MSASIYQPVYENSHALVIGINDYGSAFPPLQTALQDAEAVARTLADDLGFSVSLLRDAEATRDAILENINNTLTRTRPDDRVCVYFAGHGATRQTTHGDAVGLLVPYGAGQGDYHRLIEMDYLIDLSKYIAAKHTLFVLDACFSGLAVTRSTPSEGRLLEDLMTRRAVQAIAAGQEDQLVADRWGPGQHSIFTGLFLHRLNQRGGLLTGNEMGLYLQRQVGLHTSSRQTPHYGHLLGSEGGDFVFWAEESTVTLPGELVDAIENSLPGVREGAVRELAYLAKGSHPELATLARTALTRLLHDDSRRVSAAARAVLEEIFPDEIETYPARISTTDTLYLLVFTQGPLRGQRIPVIAAATIGRMLGNTVVIDDPRVSSFHAEIEQRSDGTLWIADLNSTNGTFVNDQPIRESQRLKAGDEVSIGDSRFRLERAKSAEVFESAGKDVTLGRPALSPEESAMPSVPVVQDDQPVSNRVQRRFARFIRRWWMLSPGPVAVLGFAGTLIAASDMVSFDSRFGALALIPGVILFGMVAFWYLRRRYWLRGALHVITAGGLIGMGVWIWSIYGIEMDSWQVALGIPVIPATIWLVLDVIRAGKVD